jgi:hypothetical protein
MHATVEYYPEVLVHKLWGEWVCWRSWYNTDVKDDEEDDGDGPHHAKESFLQFQESSTIFHKMVRLPLSLRVDVVVHIAGSVQYVPTDSANWRGFTLAMPMNMDLGFQGKCDDGDSGSEIGTRRTQVHVPAVENRYILLEI